MRKFITLREPGFARGGAGAALSTVRLRSFSLHEILADGPNDLAAHPDGVVELALTIFRQASRSVNNHPLLQP